MTYLGHDPEQFEGRIWFIPVYNLEKRWNKLHFSRTATDCKVSLRFLVNDSDEGRKIPLLWMGTEEVPTECNFSIGTENREGYAEKLGFFYLGKLFSFGLNSVIIPDNNKNKLMIAFTYPESSSLYIITMANQMGIGEKDIVKIPFDQLEKYTFLALLQREGYEDKEGRKFTLQANTWDDIMLTWA